MQEKVKYNTTVKDVIQVDSEFLDNISCLIEDGADVSLINIMADIHPADIAEIINHLNIDEAVYLFTLLDTETASEVITELDENFREKILKKIDIETITDIIDELDSDDATDILSDLSEPIAEAVLENIDKEDSEDVKELLKYPEDSAGGIMTSDFVYVQEGATVKDAIDEVRANADEFENIYYIYVLTTKEELVGIVSIKQLLTNKLSTKITEVMEEDLIYVNPEDDQEEVANIIEKYDLVSIPVVDDQKRMIGRITHDDVIDVINEEASEDLQKVAGLSEEEEISDSPFRVSRIRLPWLLIALGGEIISALVLSSFSASLEEKIATALFIPIVMAMGGSSGTQAAIVMVRGLSKRDIWISESYRKLMKEFTVAFINGFVCALVLFFVTHFGFELEPLFSMILSVSLILIMIFATMIGATIPLILNQMGIDPAIATGPFVTTMNDVVGLLIYLSLVTMFYVS